jgi:hypothetical protein
MRRLVFGLLLLGTATAFAAPRADIRDLSPLPQGSRNDYLESEYSNDGIFAPAPSPESGTVGTDARKKPTAAKPAPTTHVTTQNGLKSQLERAIDRLDVYYNGFFNGPSLDGASQTTWNPWSNGPAAFYIYHSFDVDYHFDRTNLVGFELSDKQSIVSRPNAFTGKLDEPSHEINDPQIWYKRSGILTNSAFSLDSRFSIWPAMTTYSVNDMGPILSLAWDTTWNLQFLGSSWSSYFTSRVRPTFYSDIYRPDGYMREWMYLSAGYYLGYSLSQSWQVNASAAFDCMFYAQNDQFYARGDSSADRVQFELNYNLGRLARIGAYVQAGVIDPSTSKATAGLDVTVNFL